MEKLNEKASTIASRYIVNNDIGYSDKKLNRNLQAEINKINSIVRMLAVNEIDPDELVRLQSVVDQLSGIIKQRI